MEDLYVLLQPKEINYLSTENNVSCVKLVVVSILFNYFTS